MTIAEALRGSQDTFRAVFSKKEQHSLRQVVNFKPRKKLAQPTMSTRPPIWKRQRKLIIAVIVVVILVVGVVSAALILRPTQYTIPLWYNSDGHYGDTEPTVAQVIANSIEKTGKVHVQLNSEPWAQYTTDFGNGKLPFFLLGWYPDYYDSDDYASPFLGTAGAASLGSQYSNSTMDNWLAWEAGNSSSTVRNQLFTSIQSQLASDVPYIPLWEGKANIVYKADINNVFLHPVVFRYFFMSRTTSNNTLVAGTTDRVKSLDPAYAYDYFSIEIINQVFDTLLVYNPTDQTLMPGLATSIPVPGNGVSSDLKTWNYTLRSGLKFSDGSVLNSTTVKNSIIRAITLNLPGSAAFLLSDVGQLGNTTSTSNPKFTINIGTPDATHISFHLHQPVAFFNLLMAFSVSAPVPTFGSNAYSTTGAQPTQQGKVIGDGPYTLTAYTAGQSLDLTANAGYYGKAIYASAGFPSVPIINKVTVKSETTATQLKNDLTAKSIDMAYRTLNPQDITSLQIQAASLGLKVQFGQSPQIRYLVFNVKTAPFNNVLLRRAIAYAVDRSLIANDVFNGQVDPLWSMIPPLLNYSIPVFQLLYGSSPNLTQAGNLLSQFGLSIFQTLDATRSII
jgi:peptide/nickel transport system substrate-binding protein